MRQDAAGEILRVANGVTLRMIARVLVEVGKREPLDKDRRAQAEAYATGRQDKQGSRTPKSPPSPESASRGWGYQRRFQAERLTELVEGLEEDEVDAGAGAPSCWRSCWSEV